MLKRLFSLCGLVLIISFILLVTGTTALVTDTEIPASNDPLERNSPENIALLKAHIAYVGESQEARMNGVISYIGTISGNSGTGRLEEIRNDYLSAAASIPVMQTADRINSLRDDMCDQTRLFAEETQKQMALFKGTPDGMHDAVNMSLSTFDLSLTTMTDPLWLSRDSARITVFSRESQQRNFTLTRLYEKGLDVSEARRISEQIDTKRTDLEAALRSSKETDLSQVNTAIRSLNQQFRGTVAQYQSTLDLQMKSAAILAMSG